ncbi:hypothetical protein NF701_02475 [Sphingomonadaceae bacterium OTU29THOMA1]|nr:hypothetical protein NF701_02475 [Sphingomonadaceae bacterium OTU29THOMA1]
MTAVDQAALEALVQPLATLCAEKNFEYAWRVYRVDGIWHAKVSSGFPVIDGQRTGACPCYLVKEPTPEAALARAVEWSMNDARRMPAYRSPSLTSRLRE